MWKCKQQDFIQNLNLDQRGGGSPSSSIRRERILNIRVIIILANAKLKLTLHKGELKVDLNT